MAWPGILARLRRFNTCAGDPAWISGRAMPQRVTAALLPLLLVAGCAREKKVEASAGPSPAPSVAVAQAGYHNVSRTLALTGEFKPFQEIDVMAKVAGYVKNINVDVGDRVRQGQLLATLEVPEMADDMARASATFERSQAEVKRARQELQRTQSAHQMAHLNYTRLAAVMKDKPGLVAQQEVDDAHSRDLVSEAQVAAASSGLAAAEQQVNVTKAEQDKVRTLFNYTSVVAPFAGVVTKRFADTGSMIQAGTASQTQAMPLIRLSENRLLRLIVPVPESAVPSIHVGQQVEVKVPSLGRSFPGRVARFAERVQTDTRTMPTEVDVANPALLLVPGMYAEVNLTLDQRASALAIPISAIGEGNTVYVVTPANRLEVRPVSVGVETSSLAEIRSGLKPGDLVVIGSRSQLVAGQVVRPRITELAALKTE